MEGEGASASHRIAVSAASLYYLEDVNQAAIATRLGTSRATVSRMLAEAQRRGMSGSRS